MRKIALIFAALLLAATPQSNQCIDFNTLIANQPTNYTWKTSAPAGGNKLITLTDLSTYVAGCTATGTQVATWNDILSCASGRSATQQSEAISGNYTTITYTARFNSSSGLYTCFGPNGSDRYSGTPITLPAGTVAPSSATPLRLNITSIAYSGSSSLHVALLNPSGTTVQTWSSSTSTLDTGNYTTSGAAGSWSWVITQSGGSDGACDSVNGVTAFGGTQITWSGTATWFQ